MCTYGLSWYIPASSKGQIIVGLQDFCPWGIFFCEGPGNDHYFCDMVDFVFGSFWADLTLLHLKMCRFFLSGNSRGKKSWEKGGKTREKGGRKHPGRVNMAEKWKRKLFFFLNGQIGKKMQKSFQNLPRAEIYNLQP